MPSSIGGRESASQRSRAKLVLAKLRLPVYLDADRPENDRARRASRAGPLDVYRPVLVLLRRRIGLVSCLAAVLAAR